MRSNAVKVFVTGLLMLGISLGLVCEPAYSEESAGRAPASVEPAKGRMKFGSPSLKNPVPRNPLWQTSGEFSFALPSHGAKTPPTNMVFPELPREARPGDAAREAYNWTPYQYYPRPSLIGVSTKN